MAAHRPVTGGVDPSGMFCRRAIPVQQWFLWREKCWQTLENKSIPVNKSSLFLDGGFVLEALINLLFFLF